MRLLCFIIIFFSVLRGAEKTVTILADPSLVTVQKDGEFDRISYSGGVVAGRPGLPGLPVVPITVVLPPGARDVEIKGINFETKSLPGIYTPPPYQQPAPLGQRTSINRPDPVYYNSEQSFPSRPVKLLGVGDLEGFRVANLIFYPFGYLGEAKRLLLHDDVRLILSYETSGDIKTISYARIERVKSMLKNLVLNPEDIDISAPMVRFAEDYKEVFITSQNLVSSLEPLRCWRTKMGIPCTTVVAAEIQSQYPGYDGAEKLRNFIIDANSKWGAEYFVMVGDVNTIPYRYLGTPDSSMPCDHYFADLDGDWDANGNHIYGEWPDDSVDLYHDVMVGRLPVETASECQTVVNKILTYEKNPPSGYLKRALLPAVLLWASYWGDYVNDSIGSCTPTGWQDIKLYQSQGNLTRQQVINEINSGVGFVHYAAHGNANGTYWAGGTDTVLYSTDVLNLSNGNRLGIHNAIACITGGFDLGDVGGDCFAEHLVNYSGGGAVAAIMNTRVGLGYQNTMGPSEYLSLEFYRKAFREDVHRVGEAHFLSKDVYVPLASSLWEWAFCIAEYSIFGDPVMPMWLDEPGNLAVSHPDSIPLGSQNFTVTVTDGSSPIANALVCIMTKKGEIYSHDYTSSSGQATFTINPTIADTMWVTTTAMNYRPYEGYTVIGHPRVNEGNQPKRFTFYLNPITPSIIKNSAVINFGLDQPSPITIELITADGRILGRILSGWKDRGNHRMIWDGRIAGREVESAIYFIRLKQGVNDRIEKIVIMR